MFSKDNKGYLYFDMNTKLPTTSGLFRSEFPIDIAIVPTLSPFEVDEELLPLEYINRWIGSRRSSRMFRSFWFHNKEMFSEFIELVETTWSGLSIKIPERKNTFSKELCMFCVENQISREISWAGFGFQIWLQLLTHIVNAKSADLLVIDEPEIYLHPDLQHKVLKVLKKFVPKIILATRSIEIINSVETSDVLLVDKSQKSAKRITDIEGLQKVTNLLGSMQNIHLTRLARGKKILFVEGKDLKLISKFVKILGYDEDIFNEITVIPIGGYSQYNRVTNTKWAFTEILGEEILVSALFDRDYRSDEEINEFVQTLNADIGFTHVFFRKEIENYLLDETAIQKAIDEKLLSKTQSEIIKIDARELLFEISEEYKMDVSSQLVGNILKQKIKQKDVSTVIYDHNIFFESNWKNMEYRFKIIPGKVFLSRLNEALQISFGINISHSLILKHFKASSIHEDLVSFVDKLIKYYKL